MANSGLSSISLTAVGSGRLLSLQSPGVATVVICFAQETQAGIEAIEQAVRECWSSPSDVLVAHVVDLHKVPSIFRRIAEGILAKEHQQAVEALSEGQDSFDHVIILPDWQGAVATALGLEDPSKQHGWAVLSAAGQLVDTGNAPLDGARLLEAVERALLLHP
jgi:hypothetical protein